MPNWKVDEQFKNDVFTFVRIEYDSVGWPRRSAAAGRGGFGGVAAAVAGRAGRTDCPDSDLNFSFRLQQLTSLKVNPDPITMRLTDDRLFDYPFIYIIEPGASVFSEEEVRRAAPLPAQRRLPDGRRLLGRLRAARTSIEQMKRVFPDRSTSRGAAARA